MTKVSIEEKLARLMITKESFDKFVKQKLLEWEKKTQYAPVPYKPWLAAMRKAEGKIKRHHDQARKTPTERKHARNLQATRRYESRS